MIQSDIIVVLMGLIILLLILSSINNNLVEFNTVTDKKKFSSCRKLTSKYLITQVLKKNKFTQDDKNWQLHITCKDDYTNQKIK